MIFRLLPVAIPLLITLTACSSISMKNVEIRKSDGSVLKIESLEAFNVEELELMRILNEDE